MKSFVRSISLVSLIALCAAFVPVGSPVLAAGTETDTSTPATIGTYNDAKALIGAGKYDEARVILAAVTKAEPGNADAWNLLGFSSRKSGDLKAAGKAYNKALKLNPNHLGALEYQGEMYIQLGQGDKAKANLEKLKAACGTCEEMQDLEKALKAAGLA